MSILQKSTEKPRHGLPLHEEQSPVKNHSPKVSMVANAFETDTKAVRSELVLAGIKSGKWRPPIEKIRTNFLAYVKETGDSEGAKKSVTSLKERLPGVIWSGLFERRANDAILAHSGLICADLDLLGERFEEVRQYLLKSPHLFALFKSPTWDGLKAVFKVSNDGNQHLNSYKAVEKHVWELTGVIIDESCKDVARLCFVSFDPDLYENSEAEELAPVIDAPAQKTFHNSTTTIADIPVRQVIVQELVGEVEWVSDTRGHCKCPGQDLHTTGDGKKHCRVNIDGAPNLFCVHNSCRNVIAQKNKELASRIGRAERVMLTHSPKVELPAPASPYTPPPLDLLPPVLHEYVIAVAAAINVDVAYICLPLLSALGAAVGNSRCILLKYGFTQPPIIWTGIIGRSGSRKTPSLDAACFAASQHERSLARLNSAALQEFDERMAEWGNEQKKNRGEKPEQPKFLTGLMDDLTIAALADALNANTRGVLVKKDELSHWFSSMDQFTNAKGSDVSRWLSLHSGVQFGLDRKTDKLHIRLPDPRVCITGGIQPKVLARVLTQDFFERGLPARFLLALPPIRQDRWSEDTIPKEATSAALVLFEDLYDLAPNCVDGEMKPQILVLDANAKAAYVAYYNECGVAACEADEHEEAAWSKLSGYAARLALVGQLAWDPSSERVTGEVMAAACDLARWFGKETSRIYSTLGETLQQTETRQLLDFIERRGGVTVRDVITNYAPLKNQTDRATEFLEALALARLLHAESVPTTANGGRPTKQYRLVLHTPPTSASAQPPTLQSKQTGCADADKEEMGKIEQLSNGETVLVL